MPPSVLLHIFMYLHADFNAILLNIYVFILLLLLIFISTVLYMFEKHVYCI